jgi:hypothetical protein
MALKIQNVHLCKKKFDFVFEAMFPGFKSLAKSFSAFRISKKATLMNSLK